LPETCFSFFFFMENISFASVALSAELQARVPYATTTFNDC
jgi:hypothetical protein